MNANTNSRLEDLIDNLIRTAEYLQSVHSDDRPADVANLVKENLSNIKLTAADVFQHQLKTYPEDYCSLPTHMYEINSAAMQRIKESVVSQVKQLQPAGQPYSKTSSGGFYSVGYTFDGESFDLPSPIFRVKKEDLIGYLDDWLKCNGGNSKFQFNLEQAQRHEELINVVGKPNPDPKVAENDLSRAYYGHLYVADVSGRRAWLYKTSFFLHTHGTTHRMDMAQLIEDLHVFYDQVFAELGLTMRVIFVEEK